MTAEEFFLTARIAGIKSKPGRTHQIADLYFEKGGETHVLFSVYTGAGPSEDDWERTLNMALNHAERRGLFD